MGYDDKVVENRRVLKKCRDLEAYNVGASRAYYCAFIGIKKYLINNGYDYKKFLMNIGNCGEREYSHGTVKKALFDCIICSGKKISNVNQLNILDNLYRKRRVADYEDKSIVLQQFDDSIRELDIIESILGAL